MHGRHHRLFNRNRVGCWKGIPKGLIERLFVPLALALVANRIVPADFVFWLGDHFDLSTTFRKFQALMETDRAYVLGKEVELMSILQIKRR